MSAPFACGTPAPASSVGCIASRREVSALRVARTLLLALIPLAGAVTGAGAQTPQELFQEETAACYGRANGTLEQVVTACTIALDSARLDRAGAALAQGNRGMAEYARGRKDAALGDLDDAIALGSQNVGHFMTRGMIYRDMRQYDAALSDFDQAIFLSRDFAEAYTQRGITFATIGAIERAIMDFDKAVHDEPDNPVPYEERARASRAMGDRGQAQADEARAKELRRDHAQIGAR
jgi:tetratricopeptide (TPR) repeat protein